MPKIRRIRRASKPLPIVDPDEWDYSSCPLNEVVYCFLYTLTRCLYQENVPEFVKVATVVEQLRSKASDPKSFHSLVQADIDLPEQGKGTWRLIVSFPEWPLKPWPSIPQEERARRLSTLFPDSYPTHSVVSAKDILPARLPDNFIARLKVAIAACGLPIIPIGRGCWSVAEADLMKLQGREIDWSLFELQPGEAPERFLAVSLLYWRRPDTDLLRSEANLLTLTRPPDIPQDKVPTFKETTESETKYDLQALGADWLLQRMSCSEAVRVTKNRLGYPLYTHRGEWKDARDRAKKLKREGILNLPQSPP